MASALWLLAACNALASDSRDIQSWNELDISTRFTRTLDVTWIVQGRVSSRLPNPTTYAFGTEWNFRAGKYLEVAPTWYYRASLTAAGVPQHRNLAILALTPKYGWERLTLSDRNRFIGDIHTHGSFQAYRNRPRVDYRVGPKTSVFAWGEVFYRANHDGWSRKRFAAGARKTLTDRLAADVYYQRQNDNRSIPAHVDAVCVVLELRAR